MSNYSAPVNVHLSVHLRVGEKGYATRAAALGATVACALALCGARPERRTAATPRDGTRWRSQWRLPWLLSELACREVGHSMVDHGHALAVCGVERYFRNVIPDGQIQGQQRMWPECHCSLCLALTRLFSGPEGSPEPASGLLRLRVARRLLEARALCPRCRSRHQQNPRRSDHQRPPPRKCSPADR